MKLNQIDDEDMQEFDGRLILYEESFYGKTQSFCHEPITSSQMYC